MRQQSRYTVGCACARSWTSTPLTEIDGVDLQNRGIFRTLLAAAEWRLIAIVVIVVAAGCHLIVLRRLGPPLDRIEGRPRRAEGKSPGCASGALGSAESPAVKARRLTCLSRALRDLLAVLKQKMQAS